MSKQRVKDEVKRFKSNHRGQSCEIIITAKGKTICTFEKEGVKLARAEMKLSEGDEFDYEFGVKMAKQKAYIRLADRIIEKMEKDLQEIRADKQKEIDRYNEKLEARYPGIRLRTATGKLKGIVKKLNTDLQQNESEEKLSDNSGLEAEEKEKFDNTDTVTVISDKEEYVANTLGVTVDYIKEAVFEIITMGNSKKMYHVKNIADGKKCFIPEDCLEYYAPF